MTHSVWSNVAYTLIKVHRSINRGLFYCFVVDVLNSKCIWKDKVFIIHYSFTFSGYSFDEYIWLNQIFSIHPFVRICKRNGGPSIHWRFFQKKKKLFHTKCWTEREIQRSRVCSDFCGRSQNEDVFWNVFRKFWKSKILMKKVLKC